MSVRNGIVALLVGVLTLGTGCTLQAPFDPANFEFDGLDFVGDFADDLEDFISDPLDTKPFPVLLGGNSQRLFYATNLGDVRINFPGPTNDIVLPGLLGPSNLYEYADKERDLLRPLIPAGAFTSVATDGVFVAFVAVTRLEEPIRVNVIADLATAFGGNEQILFDSDADDALLIPGMISTSAGRVAFGVTDPNTETSSIRVFALNDAENATIIETGGLLDLALLNDWLLYVEQVEDGFRAVLRNLLTNDETVVAENSTGVGFQRACLTNNTVLIAASNLLLGDTRVTRYDIATGTTTVVADAIGAFVTGAADDFFLAEEIVFANNGNTERVAIFRYDNVGNRKKLAEFRKDGLAGQSRIIGDRAVWVNRERRIIIAPLAGGDRTSFRPF